jgi:DNA-binding response OmpR family regulator
MSTEHEPSAINRPTKLRPYVRPHVLIVTSDAGLKDFLTEGLTVGGFWTSVVSSPIQALEVFRLRSFDLVLVDATLPGMGGLEVVRRLRGRSRRAGQQSVRTDVPILVIAASREEASEADAEMAGADQLLLAPIEIADVAHTLFEHLERWRDQHPDRALADENPTSH